VSVRKQWGVRLADIRVPRTWFLPVGAAIVRQWRSERRLVRETERIAGDLGDTITQRWRTGDERADELLALTRSLMRLTWALLAVAAVTLVVTISALVVTVD
jgi:hypothetical protein